MLKNENRKKLENRKYFQEDIPSEKLSLLSKIKGSKIIKLVRYSTLTYSESERVYKIPNSLLFRLTSGPLLIILESGLKIGFASLPEKVSVTLWVEETEEGDKSNEYSIVDDDELIEIDCCNPKYSEESLCKLRNKRISEVRIIKRTPKSQKLACYPCESGIVLEFEEGLELILSHGLHDDSDDFAIIYREEIMPLFIEQIQEIPI